MIHIAKKQLGMDDDTYREMLRAVAGVSSAAELSASGRQDVLDHLKWLGFASRRRPGFPGRPQIEKARSDKRELLKKIEAHLAEAGRPWKYVHAMSRRMFGLPRVQWCDPTQLWKIVAALEYDARRHGRYRGE